MRFILVFFCFLICHLALYAEVPATTLARTLDSLNANQRTLLYQFGTLHNWAGQTVADSFWTVHQAELSSVGKEEGELLAAELLQSAHLTYSLEKPSKLQALRGVFTTSRLLIGLAALIAAAAIIQLLSKYLPNLFLWLRTVLAPFIRWLFNPRALSWELLILGIIAVRFAPDISETIIRTIIIHLGFFFIWSQLTAIHTRRYLFKDYSNAIKAIFETDNVKPVRAFVEVSLPAIFTAVAIYWTMLQTQDPWYAYEIIVPVMISIFALPPLRRIEIFLNRLLFPFPSYVLNVRDQRIASYVVISIVVWVIMLLIPVWLPESMVLLSVFVIGMLLILSIEDVTRCGISNYIWMQLLTLGFTIAVILAGTQCSNISLTWTGFGGILIFVLIKYWEIPVLLGWRWKNRKSWGALGMALLIWGIAILLRNHAEWFVLIK